MIRNPLYLLPAIGFLIPVTIAAGLRAAHIRPAILETALPSWHDGPAKSAIVDFVTRVTTPGGKDFIPVVDRIAVFDNDGTLWPEQPVYFQFAFAIDRIKALAPQHPDWRDTQPFKAVLEHDHDALLASGEKGMVELMMASHAGNTTEEFEAIVKDWIATGKHPGLKRSYTELIYQPMHELIAYLEANDFETYIVSGGGVEFMRPWTHSVYGIPPEHVVGSSIKTRFEVRDGKPVLVRESAVDFVDDKEGKPVGIHKFIGRRPVFAAGNSDGDLQMLQWTTAGEGPRFAMIVHHTDKLREWAYDRESHIGRLDRALDEAQQRDWLVVDMKKAWNRIYAFEQ